MYDEIESSSVHYVIFEEINYLELSSQDHRNLP